MVSKFGKTLLLLAGLLCLAFGGKEGDTLNPDPAYLVLEATATPVSSVFVPHVYTTVSPQTLPLPREIVGFVYNKDGAPLPGILVHIASDGWEAFDASRGNGLFKFVLTEGQFSLKLVDLVSQPAFIKVDDRTDIRIEFREVVSATPTPAPSPTTTVTPTITTTPTVTVTPTVTLTPAFLTPVSIGLSPTSTPTPGPTPSTGTLFSLPEVSLGPWVRTLLIGAGLTTVAFVVGMVVVFFRRL